MKLKFSLILTGIAAMTAASAKPQVAHWDVQGLRQESMDEGYTFQVAESWVTRYLDGGGDMRHLTGLVRPVDWDKKARFVSPAEEEALMPKDFDWRRLVSGGLQPIRNQGGCGSCWAFSVTAVLESLDIIAHGHNPIDLAEQTLVSSCSGAGSCSGGYFDAFDYLKSPGLPAESSDPYRAANTSCRQNLVPKAKVARWSYVGGEGREPTTAELKAAILKYGPISVEVNASFSGYSGGVFNRCNSAEPDHMVTLEGWDDNDQAWIMRNSWGSDWGEHGYMRIKYTDGNGHKCNNIGRVAAFAEL